jgi:hypothetical protein
MPVFNPPGGRASGAVDISVTSYGATGDGTTNDTVAIQTALDAAKMTGARVLFPATDEGYRVSNLVIDYDTETLQSLTGLPYGYPAPTISGSGRRGTLIKQISGSTGPVFRFSGQTGGDQGGAHNNKITGLVVEGLEIVGTSGATNHGIEIRNFVDVVFRDLHIRNCGGSGVKLRREYFTQSPAVEEYGYNIRLDNIKILTCARYGVEGSDAAVTTTGTGAAAISGLFTEVDATNCTLGGFRLNPASLEMIGCRSIGNGGYGLETFRNTNTDSENWGLIVSGCRFEGNSAAGGYEVKIEGRADGTVLIGNTILGSTGAHLIGIGVLAAGSDSFVNNPTIIGGRYTGKSTFVGQKFLVAGSDCKNLTIINPAVKLTTFNGSPTSLDSLISETGAEGTTRLPESRESWASKPALWNVPVHTNNAISVANDFRGAWMYVARRTKANRARIRVSTNGATGNISVAIYSADGATRLSTSGAIATPAVGTAAITLPEVVLEPGWYFVGMSCDSTTPTFAANTNASVYGGGSTGSSHPAPASVSVDTGTGVVPGVGLYYA